MAINTEALSDDVRDALAERGLADSEVADAMPGQLFDEYCEWHGLIGWGATLRRVYENIYGAQRTSIFDGSMY